METLGTKENPLPVQDAGRPAIPTDREMGATATVQTRKWIVAEDVRKIIVTAVGDVNDSIVVSFDAPDDATEVSWLAGNVAESTPTMRKVVKVGTPREWYFDKPLRRIGAIDLVGTVDNVFIETGK